MLCIIFNYIHVYFLHLLVFSCVLGADNSLFSLSHGVCMCACLGDGRDEDVVQRWGVGRGGGQGHAGRHLQHHGT